MVISMTVLLTFLKIVGIIFLAILAFIMTVLLLALFVPVRYRLEAHRNAAEDTPAAVKIKITWLLHMLNVAFSYPEAAYIKVRLFCFTVFRSDKEKREKDDSRQEKSGGQSDIEERKNEEVPSDKDTTAMETGQKVEKSQADFSEEEILQKENKDTGTPKESINDESGQKEELEGKEAGTGVISRMKEFINKILSLLINIKYTITKICDKIKHIVNNIQYYINIIKSETFNCAWMVCSSQVLYLLKSIRPRKFTGSLHIGTGDPASTGQVLAIYGILYPFIGSHMDIVPDFEQKIIEGQLLIKGKITLFHFFKVAWVVYFNKDFRRLIKLFKREAA